MSGRARWTTERGALWTLNLQDPPLPPAVAPRCEANLTEAHIGDATSLARAMGFASPKLLQQRLDTGRRCFLVWVQGELAAFGWVSRDHEYVGELERTFRMGEGDVYIWDCVTLPGYRGKHLYSALLSHILVTMRDEGVSRAWIGAGLANRPSVKGIYNAGFQPVVRVVYARFLKLHYLWISSFDKAPRQLIATARSIVLTDGELKLGPFALGVG